KIEVLGFSLDQIVGSLICTQKVFRPGFLLLIPVSSSSIGIGKNLAGSAVGRKFCINFEISLLIKKAAHIMFSLLPGSFHFFLYRTAFGADGICCAVFLTAAAEDRYCS